MEINGPDSRLLAFGSGKIRQSSLNTGRSFMANSVSQIFGGCNALEFLYIDPCSFYSDVNRDWGCFK